MDDLIAKLNAALDETERIAQYSGGTGSWDVRERPGSDRAWDVVEGNYAVATVTGSTRVQHVARHDPARVLRQVAAHRKILDLHTPRMIPALGFVEEAHRKDPAVPYEPTGAVWYTACPACGGRDWDIEREDSYEPCTTVLALAEAYELDTPTETT